MPRSSGNAHEFTVTRAARVERVRRERRVDDNQEYKTYGNHETAGFSHVGSEER